VILVTTQEPEKGCSGTLLLRSFYALSQGVS